MKNTIVDLQLMIQILHEDDVILSDEDIVSFLNEQLTGIEGWENLIQKENILNKQTILLKKNEQEETKDS